MAEIAKSHALAMSYSYREFSRRAWRGYHDQPGERVERSRHSQYAGAVASTYKESEEKNGTEHAGVWMVLMNVVYSHAGHTWGFLGFLGKEATA